MHGHTEWVNWLIHKTIESANVRFHFGNRVPHYIKSNLIDSPLPAAKIRDLQIVQNRIIYKTESHILLFWGFCSCEEKVIFI